MIGIAPCYKIIVAGEDKTSNFAGKLLSLTITDQSDEQSDGLRIELANPGWLINVPEKGYRIQISLGYDGKFPLTRAFTVDEVRLKGDPDVMTISGKTAPFNAAGGLSPMQTRKTRSFDGASISAIVQAIAAENGLTPSVDPYFAMITEHIDQTEESDNALLTRLARDYDAVYKPATGVTPGGTSVSNTLVFAQASSGISAAGTTLPTATIDRLKDKVKPGWECVLSARTQFGACSRKYHDPTTGETQEAVEGDPSNGKVHQIKTPARNAAHAHHSSRSLLKSLLRGSQSVIVEMPARFDIIAEQFVALANFAPPMNSIQWLAKGIEYRLAKREGFSVRYGLEVATPKTAPTAATTSSPSSNHGLDFGPGGAPSNYDEDNTDDAPADDEEQPAS